MKPIEEICNNKEKKMRYGDRLKEDRLRYKIERDRVIYGRQSDIKICAKINI